MPAGCAETRKAAARAVRDGVSRVVAVGGDGTLSAVAGELVNSRTALGIIPAGTGNDFCRNSRIPRDPLKALALALSGDPVPTDVGRCPDGACFLNAAGLGFDAEVAAYAAGLPRTFGGTVPYVWGALSTLRSFRPLELDVTVDQERLSGEYMLVAIANGSGYGGGMQIAPLARTDDGLLDVCLIGAVSPLAAVGLLAKVFRGHHLRHPKVQVLRGSQIRLRPQRQARVHLDGESLLSDSLEVTVHPKALSVVRPPAPAMDPDWAEVGYRRSGTPDSMVWWDH